VGLAAPNLLPGPLPSFQLIWAPGLAAAVLADEICSFKLKTSSPFLAFAYNYAILEI